MQILAIAYRRYQSISDIDINILFRSTRMRWKSDFRIRGDTVHMHVCWWRTHRLIHDDSVCSLAELNDEIRWRTKGKYKIGFLCTISEIYAVLAVLCKIDKVIALHACMPRSAGCGLTGSERSNRNKSTSIAGIARYWLYAICRIGPSVSQTVNQQQWVLCFLWTAVFHWYIIIVICKWSKIILALIKG